MKSAPLLLFLLTLSTCSAPTRTPTWFHPGDDPNRLEGLGRGVDGREAQSRAGLNLCARLRRVAKSREGCFREPGENSELARILDNLGPGCLWEGLPVQKTEARAGAIHFTKLEVQCSDYLRILEAHRVGIRLELEGEIPPELRTELEAAGRDCVLQGGNLVGPPEGSPGGTLVITVDLQIVSGGTDGLLISRLTGNTRLESRSQVRAWEGIPFAVGRKSFSREELLRMMVKEAGAGIRDSCRR